MEIRGGANASRQINGMINPGFDCHRLVAVEVYTPSGNWSSYPSHKHDEHRAAAVVTTWQGKGAIPEDHTLNAWGVGTQTSHCGNQLASAADVLLAVGCRFVD